MRKGKRREAKFRTRHSRHFAFAQGREGEGGKKK